MKTVDLSNYSLAELKGLQHDIEREIKNRQHHEVRSAREKILAIAQAAGVSVDELLSITARKEKSAGQKVAAQYANPADTSMTWTGRGRQPRWVAEALAGGKTLDDLRI